ncbi:hypothetical protein ACTXT7_016761 [Hymenolepis weldensis]
MRQDELKPLKQVTHILAEKSSHEVRGSLNRLLQKDTACHRSADRQEEFGKLKSMLQSDILQTH